jgi:chemotaxis protein CheX
MLPAEHEVRDVTELVMRTVVGLTPRATPGCDGPFDLVAAVDIDGAWRGSVTLHMTWQIARRAASALLACPEHEASAADATDAAAELAAMIGGGVKGILPGPSRLSLPSVLVARREGAQGDARHVPWEAPPAARSRRLSFECPGGDFIVTVSRHIEESDS